MGVVEDGTRASHRFRRSVGIELDEDVGIGGMVAGTSASDDGGAEKELGRR